MKYVSRYGASRKITAAQYISELVCENQAAHISIELPDKFWNIEGWKNYFLSQVAAARNALHYNPEEKVIEFVKQHKIRTLRPEWVIEKLNTWEYIKKKEPELKVERSKPSTGYQSKHDPLEGLE